MWGDEDSCAKGNGHDDDADDDEDCDYLRARGMENESSVFFRKLCKACFCHLVSRHC